MNYYANTHTKTNSFSGHDIVCFSHDWGGDPLSKNHLMRLAARNNRVLWVNSIGYRAPTATVRDAKRIIEKLRAVTHQRLKQVEENIWTLSPIVIPAYGSKILQYLNQKWLTSQVRGAMRTLGFQDPINWVFNPAAATIAGQLNEQLLVYYCVDDYLEIEGVSRSKMGDLEDILIDKADVLIASAEALCESKARNGRRPTLIRHGVQYEHFRTATDKTGLIPTEIPSISKPIIGYFGLMSRDWFDVNLVLQVAKAFPEAAILLIGKSTMDLSALANEPNIHLLGQKPFMELPNYCRSFDVAILPFPVTELTRNSNPLKIREYLAAGLPVVSTRIPEVIAVGGCFVSDNTKTFVQGIREALADTTPHATRSLTMQKESWESRFTEIEGILERALVAKENNS